MRPTIFLFLFLILNNPLKGQSCLDDYFPTIDDGAKLIFVTNSWEEFNQQHLEFCKKLNIEYAPLGNEKRFHRLRSKTIKLARKVSEDIIVLSNKEYLTLDKVLLDRIDFVVKELDILNDHNGSQWAYHTKVCYQFTSLKTNKAYKLICYDELKECVENNRKSNITFPKYILENCR